MSLTVFHEIKPDETFFHKNWNDEFWFQYRKVDAASAVKQTPLGQEYGDPIPFEPKTYVLK